MRSTEDLHPRLLGTGRHWPTPALRHRATGEGEPSITSGLFQPDDLVRLEVGVAVGVTATAPAALDVFVLDVLVVVLLVRVVVGVVVLLVRVVVGVVAVEVLGALVGGVDGADEVFGGVLVGVAGVVVGVLGVLVGDEDVLVGDE